ncbi:hypothetical protein GGS20DRAFT_8394 [Poronia punctata]|nr:hypothetical protein GGS20DRAFT_8394 [Poronia punctata]
MVRPFLTTTTLLLVAASAVNAHFTLHYPSPIGSIREESEDDGPCGGYALDLPGAKVVDFHVGGDAISTASTHPQTNWLYRITTDGGKNWTQIYPIVQQGQPGQYCSKQVTVPDEFVGKKAVLNVVASGADGLLYQCSAVRFVDGPSPETPSACTNQTRVTASFTSDSALSSMVDNADDFGDVDNDDDSEDAPSPESTGNAAASLNVPLAFGGLGAVASTGVMVVAGFLLMV